MLCIKMAAPILLKDLINASYFFILFTDRLEDTGVRFSEDMSAVIRLAHVHPIQ